MILLTDKISVLFGIILPITKMIIFGRYFLLLYHIIDDLVCIQLILKLQTQKKICYCETFLKEKSTYISSNSSPMHPLGLQSELSIESEWMHFIILKNIYSD